MEDDKIMHQVKDYLFRTAAGFWFGSQREQQMTPVERKVRLVEIRTEIMKLKQEADALTRACEHEVDDNPDYATCKICKTDLGWPCKKSPDKICHHYTEVENNQLRLLDGRLVNAPEEFLQLAANLAEHEFSDDCIYCNEVDTKETR